MSSSESETEEELRQRLADQIHGPATRARIREQEKIKHHGIGKSSVRALKRPAPQGESNAIPRKKTYEPQDTDPQEGTSRSNGGQHQDKPRITQQSEPYIEVFSFKGEGFTIELYRKRFQRIDDWHILDSLFGFYFIPEDVSKPPRMLSSMEAMSKSLVAAMDDLKGAFPSQENRLVYLCIEHSKINNGLNLGCRRLNRPSQQLVQDLLDLLYNYLQSHQEMELNSDFHVSAKVISKEHENHLVQKVGWQPDQYDEEMAPPLDQVRI